jgi:hypothetical protein
MGTPRTIEDNTPIGELIAARDAELIEARDRMDAGLRLAVPMVFDGLGPDPETGQGEHLPIDDAPVTVVDDEVIGRAASKVAHFRADAAAELKHLDKHAPRRIQVEAAKVVAVLDDFIGAVGEYFREGQS